MNTISPMYRRESPELAVGPSSELAVVASSEFAEFGEAPSEFVVGVSGMEAEVESRLVTMLVYKYGFHHTK